MKVAQVKKAEDIKLKGITVQVIRNAQGIMHVHLTDTEGSTVRFDSGTYESLRAWVEAPPETVKRWVLAGQVCGAEYRHAFEGEHEAASARDKIEGKLTDDCRLTITEEDVPVEE